MSDRDSAPDGARMDPVCVFHGKRRSEHVCLYCCLCFETLTPDECWTDERGEKWDLCLPCAELERRALVERAPYPGYCRHPERCASLASCPRDTSCID